MAVSQKYRELFRGLLSGIALFLLMVPVRAQEELPDIPDMIRVTVDHATNGVHIEWEASTDPEIDFYHMYKMNEGTGTLLYKFSPNSLEYTDVSHGLENLAYTVTAVDTLDGTRSRESLLGDNVHRAVSISLEFDPCQPANIISWTGYEGWEGNISGYKIFGGYAGRVPQLLQFVHANTRSWTHKGIRIDTFYTYYIETVHTSGMASLSPIDTISSFYPAAPKTLTVDYVSVVDRTTVELQFSADVGGAVNNFRVMRRSSTDSPFTEVETILNPNQSTHLVLDLVPTLITSYHYKVQAVYQPETCVSPLVVAESNPGTSILLAGSLENQMANLSWTPYESFPNGLSEYIVQRKSGEGEFLEIESLAPGTTSWSESIQAVFNGFLPGQLQYRILAVENPAGETGSAISTSNMVGVAVETHLQVPNAFIPGGTPPNDLFMPLIDFAPKEYIMIVFDRGGRKLFETTDPGDGWDGSSGSGGYVMEGVYVYFIQYSDYTGITRSLSGNVTVIHP